MDPIYEETKRLVGIFGDMREFAQLFPGMLAKKGFSLSREEAGNVLTNLIVREEICLAIHPQTGEFILRPTY